MSEKLLLIIPPLTQLNTPYPSTAYLTGYLKSKGYKVEQCDLGIELVNKLFSREVLEQAFEEIEHNDYELDDNCFLILSRKNRYLSLIDPVTNFLKGNDDTLAYQIANQNLLPKAKRFAQTEDIDWAFGNMGIRDKAKYFATLFLEDLGDLLKATIAPHFGFTQYAERIVSSRTNFSDFENELHKPLEFTDEVLLNLLDEKVNETQPTIIGCSVPFPGNLYGAFKIAQYVKSEYPGVKTLMGGGFVNTELREISAPQVFDYFDFIPLDDGEIPLEKILHDGELVRTFVREDGKVVFKDSGTPKNIAHSSFVKPDYEGLPLDDYLSVIDVVNPMHRIWSDGRWNKLTVAHGCYWKKCTFCDVSLDYIGRYESAPARILVDHIEQLISETGNTGFHFVDEAAPPLALRDLALEIIRRDLKITWWTNIRFEKTFTNDLCKLLAQSGCIAVTGGLEVASDRLLELIDKGVSIKQVANVTKAFVDHGILVHAYLMYGFPTQTEQETIDSLEVVRQLFANGLIHSAYWHRFAMTAHSPVGKNPEKFDVELMGPAKGDFAYNDLHHFDPKGCNHTAFTEGLNAALYNFMHGIGLDYPLYDWFDFWVPKPKHPKDHIKSSLKKKIFSYYSELRSKVVWPYDLPYVEIEEDIAIVTFFHLDNVTSLEIKLKDLEVLEYIFEICYKPDELITIEELDKRLHAKFGYKQETFFNKSLWKNLIDKGLLILP